MFEARASDSPDFVPHVPTRAHTTGADRSPLVGPAGHLTVDSSAAWAWELAGLVLVISDFFLSERADNIISHMPFSMLYCMRTFSIYAQPSLLQLRSVCTFKYPSLKLPA